MGGGADSNNSRFRSSRPWTDGIDAALLMFCPPALGLMVQERVQERALRFFIKRKEKKISNFLKKGMLKLAIEFSNRICQHISIWLGCHDIPC